MPTESTQTPPPHGAPGVFLMESQIHPARFEAISGGKGHEASCC